MLFEKPKDWTKRVYESPLWLREDVVVFHPQLSAPDEPPPAVKSGNSAATHAVNTHGTAAWANHHFQRYKALSAERL